MPATVAKVLVLLTVVGLGLSPFLRFRDPPNVIRVSSHQIPWQAIRVNIDEDRERVRHAWKLLPGKNWLYALILMLALFLIGTGIWKEDLRRVLMGLGTSLALCWLLLRPDMWWLLVAVLGIRVAGGVARQLRRT